MQTLELRGIYLIIHILYIIGLPAWKTDWHLVGGTICNKSSFTWTLRACTSCWCGVVVDMSCLSGTCSTMFYKYADETMTLHTVCVCVHTHITHTHRERDIYIYIYTLKKYTCQSHKFLDTQTNINKHHPGTQNYNGFQDLTWLDELWIPRKTIHPLYS